MESIKFKCTCHDPGSKWSELPPHSMHRYRVECDRCGKFIKWGAETELNDRLGALQKISVIPYTPEPPRATLHAFFRSEENGEHS